MDGVVHYCVANMPRAVPRTSTYAAKLTCVPVGEAQGVPATPITELIRG